MELKGFLIFLALVYTMFTTDEAVRKNLGFPPPPSKKGKADNKKEEPKELKNTTKKFTLKSNTFVVCDKFNVTDCGVTLYECINGETKYECVKEEEFKVLD